MKNVIFADKLYEKVSSDQARYPYYREIRWAVKAADRAINITGNCWIRWNGCKVFRLIKIT